MREPLVLARPERRLENDTLPLPNREHDPAGRTLDLVESEHAGIETTRGVRVTDAERDMADAGDSRTRRSFRLNRIRGAREHGQAHRDELDGDRRTERRAGAGKVHSKIVTCR